MSDQPVALITGAGSGIGRATAVQLVKSGYRLALAGRRDEPLRETATLAGGGMVVAADITDPDACKSLVVQTESAFGRIDVLVNNAGFAPLAAIDQTTPQIIDECFAVNARGPAYLIHFTWPIMARQKRGCIVNVSTMGTFDPFPGFFAYAAAKASVNLMTLSCANEGRRLGIRAFAVAPGAVETAMLRGNFPESRLPKSKTLPPEAVAEVIIDCVQGRREADLGKTIPVKSP